MNEMTRVVEHREQPVRFTAVEFMQMIRHPPIANWAGKIELVDGEITRMSPTNIPHWRYQQELVRQLYAIYSELGPDWMIGSEPTVRFGPQSVRLPDVGVFRKPTLDASIFHVADLFLAVEVSDTTLRHDLGRTRTAYARAGVPHYWVVDVNGRRVNAFSDPGEGAYAVGARVRFGELLAVPGTDATITLS